MSEIDNRAGYTLKMGIPQYVPSGKEINIKDLIDVERCEKLVKEISAAQRNKEITSAEAGFLMMGAYRHLRFNYAEIAEYYAAHANEKMQRLMERSCLVLLDVDDALAAEVVNARDFIEEVRKNYHALESERKSND
jgi:hypothetical protein